MMSKMKNWIQSTSQDLKNHPDKSHPRKAAEINMPDCELQCLREELTHSFFLPLPQVPPLTVSQLWGRWGCTWVSSAKFINSFLLEYTAFQSPFKEQQQQQWGCHAQVNKLCFLSNCYWLGFNISLIMIAVFEDNSDSLLTTACDIHNCTLRYEIVHLTT